jgi:hypothetical protein
MNIFKIARVLALDYTSASHFAEGLAPVERNGKWGFVDKRGLVIVPPTFSEAGSFRNGLSRVVHHGKVGYWKAFGSRALLPKVEPMTTDTIFDMASVTKVVATTTSVMILMEEGRVRSSDRVAAFIPGYSCRSATIGSTRMALRAGSMLARSATAINKALTHARTNGSSGRTP